MKAGLEPVTFADFWAILANQEFGVIFTPFRSGGATVCKTPNSCVFIKYCVPRLIRVTLTKEKTSLVFFSNSELCWQWSSGRHRRSHLNQGEAPERIALRGPAYAFRRSSIHRGICLAGIGWGSFAHGDTRHGG